MISPTTTLESENDSLETLRIRAVDQLCSEIGETQMCTVISLKVFCWWILNDGNFGSAG